MNIALFLAGGVGKRVGTKTPKQFVNILGKPLFLYTITTVQNNPNIDFICFVCHKEYLHFAEEQCVKNGIKKLLGFVPGGKTYIESCVNGMNYIKTIATKSDNIIIIAADRPFITESEINDSINVCEEHGCGIAAKDSDTCMFYVSDNRSCSKEYLRNNIIFVGTPWTFKYNSFVEALIRFEKGDLSCEPYPPAIFAAAGHTIYFSKMSRDNIKITNNSDLLLMECILKAKGS